MSLDDYTFELTDGFGNPLEHEALPTSIRVTQVWNGPRLLEATMPLTIPLSSALQIGRQLVTLVRHELGGPVTRFHGILWSRTFSYTVNNPTVTISAMDPWAILDKRFTASNFTDEDQGNIAKALVDAENAESSTRIGTAVPFTLTKLRDRSWSDNPRPVSEALQSLTTLLDPLDIDLRPKEYDGGEIVDLIISPRVATPAATFSLGHGEGTVDNCVTITDDLNMDPVGNYIEGVGENGVTAFKTDPTSVASYGRLTRVETWDSVSEQDTLDDHAQQVLQQYAFPLPSIKVEPRRGSGIMLWDDFEVGEVANVEARIGDVTSFVPARVTEASVEITASGERLTSISLEEARV